MRRHRSTGELERGRRPDPCQSSRPAGGSASTWEVAGERRHRSSRRDPPQGRSLARRAATAGRRIPARPSRCGPGRSGPAIRCWTVAGHRRYGSCPARRRWPRGQRCTTGADDERLVLLTELTDAELGDGLLAHLSRYTVRSVDPWDLVRQMFGSRRSTRLSPSPLRRRAAWAGRRAHRVRAARRLAATAPATSSPATTRCAASPASCSAWTATRSTAPGCCSGPPTPAAVLRFTALPGRARRRHRRVPVEIGRAGRRAASWPPYAPDTAPTPSRSACSPRRCGRRTARQRSEHRRGGRPGPAGAVVRRARLTDGRPGAFRAPRQKPGSTAPPRLRRQRRRAPDARPGRGARRRDRDASTCSAVRPCCPAGLTQRLRAFATHCRRGAGPGRGRGRRRRNGAARIAERGGGAPHRARTSPQSRDGPDGRTAAALAGHARDSARRPPCSTRCTGRSATTPGSTGPGWTSSPATPTRGRRRGVRRCCTGPSTPGAPSTTSSSPAARRRPPPLNAEPGALLRVEDVLDRVVAPDPRQRPAGAAAGPGRHEHRRGDRARRVAAARRRRGWS